MSGGAMVEKETAMMMIERVARAARAAFTECEDDPAQPIGAEWLDVARAAIEAMREPAHEMSVAGVVVLMATEGGPREAGDVCDRMWGKMIAAALGEEGT